MTQTASLTTALDPFRYASSALAQAERERISAILATEEARAHPEIALRVALNGAFVEFCPDLIRARRVIATMAEIKARGQGGAEEWIDRELDAWSREHPAWAAA